MFPFRLYAATGDAVAQLDSLNGETVDVSLNLEGRGVMCVAVVSQRLAGHLDGLRELLH